MAGGWQFLLSRMQRLTMDGRCVHCIPPLAQQLNGSGPVINLESHTSELHPCSHAIQTLYRTLQSRKELSTFDFSAAPLALPSFERLLQGARRVARQNLRGPQSRHRRRLPGPALRSSPALLHREPCCSSARSSPSSPPASLAPAIQQFDFVSRDAVLISPFSWRHCAILLPCS